jgi:hypothetical protein
MLISHVECKPSIGTEKNYLLVKCSLCTKDMILTEGSVIFGNKWYHDDCFVNLTSKQVFVKKSKTQYGMKNIRTD